MMSEFSADDYRYMSLAIQLAEKGKLTTDPNPRVGCVLTQSNKIVGKGWHQKAGAPHAERNALADAGAQSMGATAYVTLEPCCHFGKTPPCTKALIEAGIERVVVAMKDPNPLVAGNGLKTLQNAGISVQTGLLTEQAENLNPGFIRRMKGQRPFVRCKLGMSLDGRTAMENGESQWITGAESRADVQRLRAESSAILTGIGTVLADDPSLNVRAKELVCKQPMRVVLDSCLRMPANAKMFGLEGETVIMHGSNFDAHRKQNLIDAGADLVCVPEVDSRLDLSSVMRELAVREVNEILIESGPTLAGAALMQHLVDELIVYVAPSLLGHKARELVTLPGLQHIQEKIGLDLLDARRIGTDLKLIYATN